jgi:hypothetical protein
MNKNISCIFLMFYLRDNGGGTLVVDDDTETLQRIKLNFQVKQD